MSLKDKLAGLAGRGGATPLGSSLATGFEAEHAKAQLATRGVDTRGEDPALHDDPYRRKSSARNNGCRR